MTIPYNNLLGTNDKSFVWGNGLISASGQENFHYLQDHLGSPIRLLGEDRDDVLGFDEFGMSTTNSKQSFSNPFGFTGYQMDDTSGLQYAQARYYSTTTARFTAQDTHWYTQNMILGDYPLSLNKPLDADFIRYKPDINAIQQSSNLYSHCISNPIRYIDLSGTDIRDGLNYMHWIYDNFPGLKPNFSSFPTNFGNRIPDIINNTIVGEIKLVKYQSNTSQIRGLMEIAQQQGKQFILIIDENITRLSRPLLDALAASGAKIVHITNNAPRVIIPIFMSEWQLELIRLDNEMRMNRMLGLPTLY